MGDNRNPFKGPFKGKGANRLAMRELETELESVHSAMDVVEEKFNQVFKRPRPILLRRLRKRSYSLLWWRMTGKNGTYVKLFDCDTGREVLASLMPNAQKVLADFDAERIRLNFRSTVVGNALNAYRIRERDLLILDKSKTETELGSVNYSGPVSDLYD